MARRRARVRPGRIPSLLSFLVGIAFVIIGLLAVIPMAGPFGLLWTAVAVGITVVNGINAFGKKGVASMEIETEDQPGDTPPSPAEPDIRERLELALGAPVKTMPMARYAGAVGAAILAEEEQ